MIFPPSRLCQILKGFLIFQIGFVLGQIGGISNVVLEEAFMVRVFKTSVLEIVFIELDLFLVLLERVNGFNRLILEKIILFLDELF